LSREETTQDVINRVECPVCGALPLYFCCFPNGTIKYLPHLDREIAYYRQEGFTINDEVMEILGEVYELENYLDKLFSKSKG
jgi:hypothetical protein